MILVIAYKELRDITRDGRFRWMAGVVLALLTAALLSGWMHARHTQAQRQAAQRLTREHWLAQPPKNPHSAAHYGIYAFKPKSPLALADPGVDAYTGVAVWLEAHKQNEFRHRPAQDATLLQRFGELTAAMALQALLPLLIILLSFSAFSGEREQGLLRQLLSLGVAGHRLAVGKALGVAGALSLVAAPAAVIGAAALLSFSGAGDVTPSFARAGVMAAGYLAYFAVFLTLSLAVSALAPSSRLSLAVLLAFWIFNTLLAPRLAADWSRRLYPTPSALSFAQAIARDMENGLDGHNPADQRLKDLQAATLKMYNAQRLEDLPVNFQGLALQAGEEYGYRVFDRRYGALWDCFERQERFQQAVALAAPLLALRGFSMGLAGTDFAQHRDFAVAAENYRRRIAKAMNDDLAFNGKTSDGRPYIADPSLWKSMPDFCYDPPALGATLARQSNNMLVLALWLALGAMALWQSARRMRPF